MQPEWLPRCGESWCCHYICFLFCYSEMVETSYGYKQQEKIRVGFFNLETASVRQAEMYVEGFKAKLKKDTSYKGLWIVSFSLKEL